MAMVQLSPVVTTPFHGTYMTDDTDFGFEGKYGQKFEEA